MYTTPSQRYANDANANGIDGGGGGEVINEQYPPPADCMVSRYTKTPLIFSHIC